MKWTMLNGELGSFIQGAWHPMPKLPEYSPTVEDLFVRLIKVEQIIRDGLTYHVDYNTRDTSHIIIAGSIKHHDVVKIYDIPHELLPEIINYIAGFERVSKRGYVDLPKFFPRF